MEERSQSSPACTCVSHWEKTLFSHKLQLFHPKPSASIIYHHHFQIPPLPLSSLSPPPMPKRRKMAQSKQQPNGFTKPTLPRKHITQTYHTVIRKASMGRQNMRSLIPSGLPDIIDTVFMSFRESFDVLWRYWVKKQYFSLFTSNSQHRPAGEYSKAKTFVFSKRNNICAHPANLHSLSSQKHSFTIT